MSHQKVSSKHNRGERRSPHERYDSDNNWHDKKNLPDGTSIGKMGASWYILDENGVPLPMKDPSYELDENGFHNIKKVDDGYIVNSGGGLGSWGRVRISDSGLSVVRSFKGRPPIGDVATRGKAFRKSLNKLNVLPLPEYLRMWSKRVFWGFMPISILSAILSPSLGGFLFVALPILSVLLHIVAFTLRTVSSEKMWDWDTISHERTFRTESAF